VAVEHDLRRVNTRSAVVPGLGLLALAVARIGESVTPAQIIPVVDVKCQGDDAGTGWQSAQPVIGRRARTATLARVQLNQVRARVAALCGALRMCRGRSQRKQQQQKVCDAHTPDPNAFVPDRPGARPHYFGTPRCVEFGAMNPRAFWQKKGRPQAPDSRKLLRHGIFDIQRRSRSQCPAS
jgi:hypothetical protein